MDVFLISLKNLYRVITVKDYPLYSSGVLFGKNRRGITLVSFWRELLIPEWKEGRIGKELWKKDERSRYLSDFCNKRHPSPNDRAYQNEIFAALNQETYLFQIRRCMDFLSGHHYDSEIFRMKCDALIRNAREKDVICEEDVMLLSEGMAARHTPGIDPAFADAWLFAALIIYSLTLPADSRGTTRYKSIFAHHRLEPDLLWQYEKKMREIRLPLRYRVDEIWNVSRNPAMIFGREGELFELTEAVRQKRKLFLTGIGGIGKTELLRQLVSRYLEPRQTPQVIAVQYDGGLRQSLVRSLDHFSGESLEERFFECLYWIRSAAEEAPVLLIDNAEVEPEDLECWRELAGLPCPVIVTSRGQPPEGFENWEIPLLPPEAAWRLLRLYYGRDLPEQEKDLLRRLTDREFFRHPLSIRMSARAAASNGWTVEEMMKRFADSPGRIVWKEDQVPLQMSQIFRMLYQTSGIPEEGEKLLKLMALLPYEPFSAEKLHRFFRKEIPEEVLDIMLRELLRRGWLEENGERYSLHPMIAECLRENGIDGNAFADFFALADDLLRMKESHFLWKERITKEQEDMCRYLLRICRLSRPSLSVQYVELVILAARALSDASFGEEQDEKLTAEIVQQVTGLSDQARVDACLVILGGQDIGNIEFVIREYDRLSACEDLEEEDLVLLGGSLYQSMVIYGLDAARAEKIRQAAASHVRSLSSRFLLLSVEISIALNRYEVDQVLSSGREAVHIFDTMPPEQHSTRVLWNFRVILYQMATAEVLKNDLKGARDHIRRGNLISTRMPDARTDYLQAQVEALLARSEGDLDVALQKYDEAAEIMERICGEKSLDLLDTRMEKAIVLNLCGRTEEAIETARLCIEICRRIYPSAIQLPIWLNNLGVFYLGAENAAGAEKVLLESLQRAKDRDPIQRAEPSCNLSKAYRKMGETEKERRFLLDALPVFRSFYGDEHPKTVYAAERLEELESEQEGGTP